MRMAIAIQPNNPFLSQYIDKRRLLGLNLRAAYENAGVIIWK